MDTRTRFFWILILQCSNYVMVTKVDWLGLRDKTHALYVASDTLHITQGDL